jgi:spore coat-associated protein N
MKKIMGLTIAALLIIGIVGGGTYAYFSDTESSTGNTLSAATLDLKINGGDAAITTFDVSNVAPGDSGSANSTLRNAGSITGELDVATSAITNTPYAGGGEFQDGTGDLGANAEIAMYIDIDMSGGPTAGDVGLKSDGTTYDPSVALDYDVIDNYDTENWDAVANMATAVSYGYRVEWRVDTSIGNAIQGDSVSFDVDFVLEQP